MSKYSEMAGSFIRTGGYPLEADYIFESEEKLKEFYSDSKPLLHKGWFKIVDNGETQSLYWVVNKNGELTFTKVISEGSIDQINTLLSELSTKLEEEIATREENDTDEQSRLAYLEESIKAIVGSDSPVKDYLQGLDYKNLTELSDTLSEFLTTYTDDDSIDTLPEIKDFLAGYTHTHNLEQVLDDLWNKIEGTPTPNTEFRTLRGIQDFVTLLAQTTKNRADNLQSEINQTQIGVGLDSDGSFSPDQETNYLKTATSVMNALRTLDSLINQAINNCNIQPKSTNTVTVDVIKEPTKTTISAQVKLSTDPTNDIQVKDDGLYHNIDSEYQNGILTIKVNGNVRKQHILGLSSIVDNAYYDADKESIIIVFKLQNNDTQTITIPVASLISEWEVDNSNANKVVELTKERVVSGGADKLSADVRLSTNKTNMLEKDNNTLLVRGTTDNITHKGESLEKIIDEIKTPEPYIFNTLQEAINANLKEGETFLLKESNTYDGQYKLVTSIDELEDRGKYIITYGDKGMAMQNGDVRKALDISVVDDTVTLEEGSLIQPVILHKHNDGYLLEVENDMFLKGGTLGTLKADSFPNASTFTFAIVPTAHAFEITTPIGSTEGVLRLQFNYSEGDKFACYDGTMYDVYLYKAVKPIYKGYYVVTKEGFEVLSLDEVLLNNINILSSDLHTITHQINSEIEAIQLEIERIKEKVDTFDWYEGD